MVTNIETIPTRGFLEAVEKGLGQIPKSLPSWLLYDEAGDKIFQNIMRIPEYYPTRCEYQIFENHNADLLKYFTRSGEKFRLIELGAGDGLKTEVLLKHFLTQKAEFIYLPIDVSENVLQQLTIRLNRILPELVVQPINNQYNEALDRLRQLPGKKIIMFLGSTIGNFNIDEARQFLKRLAGSMGHDDLLLIGFDLKKDPRIIQAAYDDPGGVTKAFNLNLLVRLNRELGADFNPEDFSHYPYYDPVTGTTKSFLISMKDQMVHFENLKRSIHFGLWEPLQTEISQKFDMSMIEGMLSFAGLKITDLFYDSRKNFCDVIIELIK